MSPERRSAYQLVDRLVADIEDRKHPLADGLRERWSRFYRQDRNSRLAPLREPVLPLLRRLWAQQVENYLTLWKQHYLDRSSLEPLAVWLTDRLLGMLGAGWPPEEADLQEALRRRWQALIQEELEEWELYTRAAVPAGRVYDFRDGDGT